MPSKWRREQKTHQIIQTKKKIKINMVEFNWGQNSNFLETNHHIFTWKCKDCVTTDEMLLRDLIDEQLAGYWAMNWLNLDR